MSNLTKYSNKLPCILAMFRGSDPTFNNYDEFMKATLGFLEVSLILGRKVWTNKWDQS